MLYSCLVPPAQAWYHRLSSLEHWIQDEAGVPEDAILAYLSDGRRLFKENIRDLAGVEDQVRTNDPDNHRIYSIAHRLSMYLIRHT